MTTSERIDLEARRELALLRMACERVRLCRDAQDEIAELGALELASRRWQNLIRLQAVQRDLARPWPVPA